MTNKKPFYHEQFTPWLDGRTVFVGGKIPRYQETVAAIEANYEIMVMMIINK